MKTINSDIGFRSARVVIYLLFLPILPVAIAGHIEISEEANLSSLIDNAIKAPDPRMAAKYYALIFDNISASNRARLQNHADSGIALCAWR